MGYVAVDKDGTEYLYNKKPVREGFFWSDTQFTLEPHKLLKDGSIEKLIGHKLTWQDEPVELKINKE